MSLVIIISFSQSRNNTGLYSATTNEPFEWCMCIQVLSIGFLLGNTMSMLLSIELLLKITGLIATIFFCLKVVGPPGTGKTDVAVQIISNIYHNFPEQRTLIVTHSNQVNLTHN